MITIYDINNMIAKHFNEYCAMPTKICMRALDYDFIRHDCMNLMNVNYPSAGEIKRGLAATTLFGLPVSIGDKTCVMQ